MSLVSDKSLILLRFMAISGREAGAYGKDKRRIDLTL
jgi:hypothetical protein